MLNLLFVVVFVVVIVIIINFQSIIYSLVIFKCTVVLMMYCRVIFNSKRSVDYCTIATSISCQYIFGRYINIAL